jgi:alpha-L-rhamnosidase
METAMTNFGPLAPALPRCEYQINPLGLQEVCPRFFWIVNDPSRGARQSAYQIVIASTPDNARADRGDLWDSGKTAGDQSIQIEYAGAKLTSAGRYYWKVRTWDAQDRPSAWSEIQWFEMGLLKPSDWKASWISAVAPQPDTLAQPHAKPPGTSNQLMPCPLLRKTLALRGKPLRARAYVTARGLYELYVNGRRIGADCFTPGWTDYHKRIQYQTYDITDLLTAGDNVLGAVLSDGWYCGNVGPRCQVYGRHASFLAQVQLEYEHGPAQTVVTDESWKTSPGPIVHSDFMLGETRDGRRELSGWSAPNFDAAPWTPVHVEAQTGVPLLASASPRVLAIEEIKPRAITRPQPGKFIFDLGQNMVGVVRLTLPPGTAAGTAVTIRHAEVLNPDGTLYTANLREAKATDTYIARGSAQGSEDSAGSAGGAQREVFQPHFTFHGFRYVEVSGYPGQPDLGAVTGVVLHSATAPAGTFACSHELINQLQHNIIWGQKGNFLEVPTDCPQRNERLGWMGDAQVFARTASFNMDTAGFFTKWLMDVDDAQAADGAFTSVSPDALADAPGMGSDGGPGWADAGIIVPWTLYRCYGDKRVLERHYPAMVRYAKYLSTCDPRRRHNYADWLHHDAHTPLDLLAVAFQAHSLDLLARIADVLGKKRAAATYAGAFRRAKAQFNRHFVTPEGRILGDTQTAYILALRFDLLPDKLRPVAVANLVFDIEHGRYTNTWRGRNNHLSSGFLGVRDLNFVLTDGGKLDLAYQLLLTEDYPSWLFPVKNGATTIWERWDGWTPDKGFQDPGMNSFNHYAYGAIGQWLYQVVAGLDLDAADSAGYRQILIHPHPPANRCLTWAKAAYNSIRGRIESSWKIDGDRFLLDALIPANTSARIVLPAGAAEAVTEAGQPLAQAVGANAVAMENGHVVCSVGAGHYQFDCPMA